MHRDDRDDPFDEFFQELERMMNEMIDGDVTAREAMGDGGGSAIHLDVYEADETVRVVADLPGVDKEAIDLKCDGEHLTINARSNRREFDERVSLPSRVDEHSANATYNNGVLEVTFDRADSSADIDLS